VLLTSGSTMPPATATYIAAHSAASRLAGGGPAAQADPQADKIVGVDRYETATLVAKRFFTDPRFVGVASGEAFADALAGGPHAVTHGGPVLLVRPDTVPDVVRTYLTDNADTIDTATLYGGTSAISPDVEHAVQSAIS
jgi:putative cell wall-binding protein